MLEFELLARNLYTSDQLCTDYDPSRRMSLTAEQEAVIETRWQERLAIAKMHNRWLYDGQLFRLTTVEASDDGTLLLSLGDVGYREYTATRDDVVEQARPRFARANPLSVCGAVETSDGFILLERRPALGVHAGRYHVIGGFTDRSMDIHGGRIDFFAAMRRELREETGIRADDILEQQCLGVVYDLVSPHPELAFGLLLHISYEEVLTREPEDDEIEQMLTLPATPEAMQQFLIENRGKISPTGEATLLLHGAYRFGEQWYEAVMAHIG